MSPRHQTRPKYICETETGIKGAVLTEAGRLSALWKGPCVSFQDLITREKNGARGGSWSPDKKSQVVSVQISSRHTKGDMGREGKIERAREKEDELLRLDRGQNCLSALVMANTNRPLLISLDLLSLTCLPRCFSVPLLSLLLTLSSPFPCSLSSSLPPPVCCSTIP